MRVIAAEDRVDLRTIVARGKFLKKMERTYRIKDNEAICFTNKALTRFRLIFKVNKILFMCIPEIDEQAKHSVYLKISEQLAVLTGVEERIKFDLYAKLTKARIARQRKKRRKQLMKKRDRKRTNGI